MTLEQIFISLSDKIGGVSERVAGLTQNVLTLQKEVEDSKEDSAARFKELSTEIIAIKLSLNGHEKEETSSASSESSSEKKKSKLNLFEVWRSLPEGARLGIIVLVILTLKDGLASALTRLLAYLTKGGL